MQKSCKSTTLLPYLSVAANVALPLELLREPPHAVNERVSAMLSAVGLDGRATRMPRELSGGERQRVAIARALVNHPSILLADEPTGALDTHTGNEIMALFGRLHEQGNTVILVTHEHDIALYANRIIHIRDGAIERDEQIK